MKPSEYRYQIESAHYEVTQKGDWLMNDSQFKLFADMARDCKSGELVLDNWKIFLGSDGGSPEDYFEWWNEYRPDKIDYEPEKKKSPFDGVKKSATSANLNMISKLEKRE